MTIEILAKKDFTTRVVSETSYGIKDDYGVCKNTMELMRVGDHLQIEWIVMDKEGNDIDVAHIGIWTAGRTVTDVDGTFDTPKEALELMREYGLDTKEIEVDLDEYGKV